jgi:hypothetical protein
MLLLANRVGVPPDTGAVLLCASGFSGLFYRGTDGEKEVITPRSVAAKFGVEVMSNQAGLADLVREIKDASANIRSADDETRRQIRAIEASVNELYKRTGRPGSFGDDCDTDERKSAIELCQIRKGLIAEGDATAADYMPGVWVVGPLPPPFSASFSTADLTAPCGALSTTCVVDVSFAPTTSGSFSDELFFGPQELDTATGVLGNPIISEVNLSGTGVAAVSNTPLPATLPLFATGLGALGLLGWFRKRKTHANMLGAA